jgi:pyroglutamyl-peptidase
MGSQVESRDEVTVLVTGFGPFREGYPVNPAWEIARGLPAHLPALRAKDPEARQAPDLPAVRIQVHPAPVRVNYKTVRALVPTLWETKAEAETGTAQEVEQQEPASAAAAPAGRGPDIVIHIGMASPGAVYQIERRGHRTGYHAPDVDGERLEDEFGDDATRHGPAWPWYGLPDELETDLDVPDVWTRWRQHSAKHLDLRISDDAGRYLCDFIYYSSLAVCYKQQRPRKVLFLHVPSDASEAAVARGRELAVNLVRAVVESEDAARRRGKDGAGNGGEL